MDFRWYQKLSAAALSVLIAPCGLAQQAPNAPAPPPGPVTQTIAQQAAAAQQVQPVAAGPQPFNVTMPHSWNPLAPYKPTLVPPVDLTNSPRLKPRA